MKTPRIGRPGPLFAALLVGLVALGFAWYFRPLPVRSPAESLATDLQVRVERASYGLRFSPLSGASSLGLVFYPGARVPPEAYAYLGRATARAGYETVIASFPLNFALFGPSKAETVRKAIPEVKAWVIGGHFLGGSMAAAYAAAHPKAVAGLILLASYPRAGTVLAASTLPVLSISASNDGLATPALVAAARHLLPATTRYVEVAGGSHAQFGDYGLQPGDGLPDTPAQAQHRAVIEESLAFMDMVLAKLR
jgi:hypothetical protein